MSRWGSRHVVRGVGSTLLLAAMVISLNACTEAGEAIARFVGVLFGRG